VLVSWSTSLFSIHMAISQTKGQGWRVILTQWRKASPTLTSTLAVFLFSSHPKTKRDREARLDYYASTYNREKQLPHHKTKLNQQQQPFYGPLSGTTRASGYQKKHSPTHHPDHHPIFISFFHLPRSIASSLFKLIWFSFVLFDLRQNKVKYNKNKHASLTKIHKL